MKQVIRISSPGQRIGIAASPPVQSLTLTGMAIQLERAKDIASSLLHSQQLTALECASDRQQWDVAAAYAAS